MEICDTLSIKVLNNYAYLCCVNPCVTESVHHPNEETILVSRTHLYLELESCKALIKHLQFILELFETDKNDYFQLTFDLKAIKESELVYFVLQTPDSELFYKSNINSFCYDALIVLNLSELCALKE